MPSSFRGIKRKACCRDPEAARGPSCPVVDALVPRHGGLWWVRCIILVGLTTWSILYSTETRCFWLCILNFQSQNDSVDPVDQTSPLRWIHGSSGSDLYSKANVATATMVSLDGFGSEMEKSESCFSRLKSGTVPWSFIDFCCIEKMNDDSMVFYVSCNVISWPMLEWNHRLLRCASSALTCFLLRKRWTNIDQTWINDITCVILRTSSCFQLRSYANRIPNTSIKHIELNASTLVDSLNREFTSQFAGQWPRAKPLDWLPWREPTHGPTVMQQLAAMTQRSRSSGISMVPLVDLSFFFTWLQIEGYQKKTVVSMAIFFEYLRLVGIRVSCKTLVSS